MPIETKDKISNRVKRNKIRKRNISCIIIGTIVITAFGIYKIDDLCKQHTVSGAVIEEKSNLITGEYNARSSGTEENDAVENLNLQSDNSKEEENDYLMLINKKSGINESYIPPDLVIPNVKFRVADDMCREMRLDAANALENMFNDAKNDGINLIAISGYRSYDYQKVVYDRSVETEGQEYTNNYVAIPGTSEHQTGLVMDLLSDEYLSLDEGFENTMAFKWIMENMSNYGFILRYPKGKESITGYDYEPWHLRYVGVDVAKEIMSNGITLEEYLEN